MWLGSIDDEESIGRLSYPQCTSATCVNNAQEIDFPSSLSEKKDTSGYLGKKAVTVPESPEQSPAGTTSSSTSGATKGLGYIRVRVTDDTLTSDMAFNMLAKLQNRKPIVAGNFSFFNCQDATSPTATINARTCCTVTMAVMDTIHAIIVGMVPGCNYAVTNRDLGGPPLPPTAQKKTTSWLMEQEVN
ncbi:uncharacterized protein LY79DRAFT_585205 [Colletotrichum navitas]|uniref:Uncharacterized protein n=1 Tax=Colletotrichum navitas TaxID=681940 RepID=A0AAD8PJS6_9PEZI|nr:uncharacterized protein LY79DRAFT_585205 [Colletotrichum navitas]KAK1564285.1 hypothetical protein LY79DRAFT_585205 [Colletotrichum navitas]